MSLIQNQIVVSPIANRSEISVSVMRFSVRIDRAFSSDVIGVDHYEHMFACVADRITG